jgi:hypothetical protein
LTACSARRSTLTLPLSVAAVAAGSAAALAVLAAAAVADAAAVVAVAPAELAEPALRLSASDFCLTGSAKRAFESLTIWLTKVGLLTQFSNRRRAEGVPFSGLLGSRGGTFSCPPGSP